MMAVPHHPMTPTSRAALVVLATMASGASLTMAALAAVERGSTATDKGLHVVTAAVLALGCNLLPGLALRGWRMAWLVAGLCLVATLYNQAHWYASAGHRAGDARATAEVTLSQSAQVARDELASLAGTPTLAQAGDALAKAQAKAERAQAAQRLCDSTTPGRCTAAATGASAAVAHLRAAEQTAQQAQRVGELRRRLAAEAQTADTQRQRAATDPVDARLAELTGWSPAVIGLGGSLLQGALLEGVAALLWAVALASPAAAPSRNPHVSTDTHPPLQGAHREHTRIPSAIRQRLTNAWRHVRQAVGRDSSGRRVVGVHQPGDVQPSPTGRSAVGVESVHAAVFGAVSPGGGGVWQGAGALPGGDGGHLGVRQQPGRVSAGGHGHHAAPVRRRGRERGLLS